MFIDKELITISPTLFSSEGYQALHGKPILSLPLGTKSLHFFQAQSSSTDIFLQLRAPFIQSEFLECSPLEFEAALAEGIRLLGGERVIYHTQPAPYSFTLPSTWGLGGKALELYEDTNFHIPITGTSFVDSLPGDQRRILRQMREQGHKSSQVTTDSLTLVYQIIAKNRTAKGYPINIALGALVDAFVALPQSYLAFIHTNELQIPVGAAIVVKVLPTHWYTFMLGHIPGSSGSPILGLLDAIYQDAQSQEAKFLDLGTASLRGELIEGLAQFKRSVGGIASAKTTFVFKP